MLFQSFKNIPKIRGNILIKATVPVLLWIVRYKIKVQMGLIDRIAMVKKTHTSRLKSMINIMDK